LVFALIMDASVRQRKYTAIDTLRERVPSFPGAKRPWGERAMERKFHRAKVPWSELARVLRADSLRVANWPGGGRKGSP